MDIEELAPYGRYYRREDEGFQFWWFDLQKDSVCSYEDLLQMFGYSNEEEILSSDNFIPLFRTDIEEVEKEFLLTRGLKIKTDGDFDIEFRIYIERKHLETAWYEFESSRLRKDAAEWCRKNHIRVQNR